MKRDPSPQFDYTLGASVYNGDKPIPKPPSTKPVHLGSLNFSTLKSNESKASTSQSFKLPRLMLDENTLNRSLEKLSKKDSDKKKKFSPYRSNSQLASRESAKTIINNS